MKTFYPINSSKLHRFTHLTIIEEATDSHNNCDKSDCVVCKPSQPIDFTK